MWSLKLAPARAFEVLYFKIIIIIIKLKLRDARILYSSHISPGFSKMKPLTGRAGV